MDDIRTRLTKRRHPSGVTPVARTPGRRLVFALGRLATKKQKTKTLLFTRVYLLSLAILFIGSIGIATLQPLLVAKPYRLSKAAQALLPKQSQKFADLLKFDAKEGTFQYNAGYNSAVNPES